MTAFNSVRVPEGEDDAADEEEEDEDEDEEASVTVVLLAEEQEREEGTLMISGGSDDTDIDEEGALALASVIEGTGMSGIVVVWEVAALTAARAAAST